MSNSLNKFQIRSFYQHLGAIFDHFDMVTMVTFKSNLSDVDRLTEGQVFNARISMIENG